MDKEEKKKLKAQFMQREQDKLRTSIPIGIDELKALFIYLSRDSAPACDHTLKDTNKFLASENLDSSVVVPWLNEHGGFCDCEVIANVYDEVGEIVSWHLD